MGFKIAVSGKGGTGKTTLAGLLITVLMRDNKKPVLAIDADANATLSETLGVTPENTIGDLREDTRRNITAIPTGIPKETFIELRVQEAITEGEGFDLLVMGRPEGSGCYCYVNSVLRAYIDALAENYPYIVMDNEAGMEHLSRRTSKGADVLIICSDPSVRGVRTAERIALMAAEEDMLIGRVCLVFGRMHPGTALPDTVRQAAADSGLEVVGVVPFDPIIEELDEKTEGFTALPEDSPALSEAREILRRIL
jgi:CO dehydrogenase maturation factor